MLLALFVSAVLTATSTVIDTAAVLRDAVQAERLRSVQLTEPPPPPPAPPAAPVDGDCESWRPLLAKYAIPYEAIVPIMRRESNCSNVYTWRPSTRDDSFGPLQINRWGSLDEAWAAAGFSREYMATPEGAIHAASVYFHACGLGPWTRPYSCPGGWPL